MRPPRARRLATSLVAAALLTACFGDSSTGPGSPPNTMISDGSREGGNPNFFFLPPLVPNPSGDEDFDAGEFNGSWSPVVEVCEVSLANLAAGCTGGVVRTYSGTAVTVSLADEHYQVQVDTREAWAVGGKTYRATVLLVGKRRVELGFIDVTLSTDKGSAKNVRYEDVVTLSDGRTLPLKFRIENGASVSPDAPAYAEQVVTQAGAIVRTDASGGPGSFVAQFPAGWLPEGFTSVIVTIEQLNVGETNPCLVSVPNLIQTSDCWRVETYPQLPSLAEDVIVAFCPTIPATNPVYGAQSIFKFDSPATLRELANVATGLIDCDGAGPIGRLPDDFMGRLRHRALALARGVGNLVAPRELHAIDAGWGGRIAAATGESVGDGAFSEFFWGVPVQVEIFGGNGQSAAPGSALATPLSVRVTGTHEDGGVNLPVPGVVVTFAPSAGSVSAATAITNADGVASVSWTLGSAAGAQALVASVPNVGTTTTVTFDATAAPTVSIFLGDNDITGTTQSVDTDFSDNLTISTSGPGPCVLTTNAPSIVNVDGSLVVANAPGTAVITAACGATAIYGTATVTFVVTAAPASIALFQGSTEVTGTTQNVVVGFSQVLAIITSGVPGGCTSISPSPAGVVTVAGNLITAVAPGTTLVTVTCPPATATVTYVVTAAPLAVDSIRVSYATGNVVGADNAATIFYGFTGPTPTTFTMQPWSGGTVHPSPSCTYNLTNPPSAAVMSITGSTSTTVTLTTSISSPVGQPSQLAVTCNGSLRTIAVTSQSIPG